MSFINTSSTARPVVIGIDHGFGNIKTAHSCFKTGVTAYDQEPTFKSNLLVYDGRYYIIGDDHKEFTADKSQDQDYYILTLAAVAVELRFRDLTSAHIYLAAGLPLTWVRADCQASATPKVSAGERQLRHFLGRELRRASTLAISSCETVLKS